jgi:hypothetical protein
MLYPFAATWRNLFNSVFAGLPLARTRLRPSFGEMDKMGSSQMISVLWVGERDI